MTTSNHETNISDYALGVGILGTVAAFGIGGGLASQVVAQWPEVKDACEAIMSQTVGNPPTCAPHIFLAMLNDTASERIKNFFSGALVGGLFAAAPVVLNGIFTGLAQEAIDKWNRRK